MCIPLLRCVRARAVHARVEGSALHCGCSGATSHGRLSPPQAYGGVVGLILVGPVNATMCITQSNVEGNSVHSPHAVRATLKHPQLHLSIVRLGH